jgi:thiosulfate/3-mercaptopyruvate sulfurtransferase
LERIGIGDESIVMVYFADGWISPAGRVLLTLDYMGLGGRTALMDGGLASWKAEGREVTAKVAPVVPGKLTTRERNDVVVKIEWVRDQIGQPGVAIIDARNPEFYSGEKPGMATRAGHIPTAVNLPFTGFTDELGKLKDKSAIEELFRQAGVKPGQTVVTYCHIGQQASWAWFVARTLGYEARMYDGSFTEWSSKAELPVKQSTAKQE